MCFALVDFLPKDFCLVDLESFPSKQKKICERKFRLMDYCLLDFVLGVCSLNSETFFPDVFWADGFLQEVFCLGTLCQGGFLPHPAFFTGWILRNI